MRLEGKDVRSLKEKWEGSGKGIHEGCGQNYGNGKGTGNLAMKKICLHHPANKKKIASEAEKVFARILTNF